MRRAAIPVLPSAALTAALLAACAWAAAAAQMGDYAHELRPALTALLAGDLNEFAAQAPVYGGSVWPRLPFAWAASALGGGDLAVYRAGAFAALLFVVALAVWLERRMRAAARPLPDRLAVVLVVMAAPLVLRTLADGHPEDLIAATCAIAAVLLALRDRPALAGLALGAAIAGKPWAVVAAAPVLAAAPGRRALLLATAAASAAVLVLPLLALASDRAAGHGAVLTSTGWIFHPQQVFWPLREAAPNGGLTGPGWLAPLTRPLIVGGALVAGALWARRRRATGAPASDALLLLALVLLARCVLDPWNNAYYAVPLILALATWEGLERHGLPVLALAATALTWLSFVRLPGVVGPDALATCYLAWTLPLAAVLGRRLVAGPRPARQATSSAIAARTAPGST